MLFPPGDASGGDEAAVTGEKEERAAEVGSSLGGEAREPGETEPEAEWPEGEGVDRWGLGGIT